MSKVCVIRGQAGGCGGIARVQGAWGKREVEVAVQVEVAMMLAARGTAGR